MENTYRNIVCTILLVVFLVPSFVQAQNKNYHSKIIYDASNPLKQMEVNKYKIYDEYFITDSAWKMITLYKFSDTVLFFSENKLSKFNKQYLLSSKIYRLNDTLLLYKAQGILQSRIIPDFDSNMQYDITPAVISKGYNYIKTFFIGYANCGTCSVFYDFPEGEACIKGIEVSTVNINIIGYSGKRDVYFFPTGEWTLHSYSGNLAKSVEYKIIPFKANKHTDYNERIRSVKDGKYFSCNYSVDNNRLSLWEKSYYKNGSLTSQNIYFENGKLKWEIEYIKCEEKKCILYTADGKIDEIMILNKHGYFDIYYPSMKIMETTYRKLKREKGSWFWFWVLYTNKYDESGKILGKYDSEGKIIK